METTANEILENSAASGDVVVEQNHENRVSETLNHGGMESQPIFTEEEVRGTLEISASTGKFWQDWKKLKNILSYHLKQVLSEYPEAKMTSEQQTSSLGETFEELVKRLDNALHNFDEGPPFTLQRLCEILLSARSIYPKLLKLSLALEKFAFSYKDPVIDLAERRPININFPVLRSISRFLALGKGMHGGNLLVTSTLTISSNPDPLATEQNSNGSYEGSGNAQPQINSVENGVEPSVGDRDEVMAEVQEAEVGEDMTMDMETIEDIVRSSEGNPTPTVDS